MHAKGQPSEIVPASRIPSLDGLRALSISLVLLGHLAGTRHFPIQSPNLMARYADVGVRIFFLISGFLITTLLLREQEATATVRLKEFYVRRAYRILPAAYFYMVVVSVVFHAALSPKDLVLAFTYLTCYSLYRPWILGHLWSLSVEEQFYMLWPLTVREGAVAARRVAIGVIVCSPLLRFVLSVTGHGLGNESYFPLVADAIATGCVLALLQSVLGRYRSFFLWVGFPVIWALTLALPILFWSHGRRYSVLGLPLLHTGLALCIQNAMVARYRLLNARPVVWIGALSYSLYLWQEPFLNRYSTAWYTGFPENISLAALAAALSYYLIERPALRWRDKTTRGAAL